METAGATGLYLPVVRSGQIQVRSKNRGRIFWTRIKRPKTPKKRPKTPKNAPKRPKNAQNAPKTPVFWRRFDLKTPVFFSSVQFRSVFPGQFRSFQVSSGQVPDLIGRALKSSEPLCLMNTVSLRATHLFPTRVQERLLGQSRVPG